MSKPLEIPEEAVDAAAKALYATDPARNYLDDTLCSWDDLAPFGTGIRRREKERDKARAALEAAAPYILAGAWDEGMETMYNTTSSEWPPVPEQNPYRKPRA